MLFTLEQAATGILATGRPGGGKTSFIRKIMAELIRQGAKCLWCCVKPDECDNATTVIRAAGKTPRVFHPETEVFNPLVYEMTRKGGSAFNLARFHDDLNEVLTRSDSAKTEPFWKNITNDSLTNAFTLAFMVLGEDATYRAVYDILMGAPVSIDDARSEEFRFSYCGQLINAALGKDRAKALPVADFFLRKLPSVGEKARGAAVTQATSSIQPFTVPPISDAVNGRSTITPEDMLAGYTILPLDTLTYGSSGLAFQLISSWMCQEACLRRRGGDYFVLVRDEYPHLGHARRDVQAQSVGRSQRYIGVSAYQTQSVLVSMFGGGMEAKSQADAIFGLHVNHIMCNCNDVETNDENARLIGMERKMFFGGGTAKEQKPAWYDFLGVGGQPKVTFNQQWHYKFPPGHFTRLKTGGHENNLIVEAVIHRGHEDFHITSIRQDVL